MGLGDDGCGRLSVSVRDEDRERREKDGALTARLVVTTMPDYVVWLPTNAPDCAIRSTLRADAGAVVRLAAAVTSPAATRTDNSEVSA